MAEDTQPSAEEQEQLQKNIGEACLFSSLYEHQFVGEGFAKTVYLKHSEV